MRNSHRGGLPPARRLADTAPSERIPSTPGREAGCPTRTWTKPELTSASATANAPPSDSRAVCAPGAERFLPLPGAVCASPAERGIGRPDAPDTPKPERGEPHMAAAAPRAAAAWRARGRGSAGASGWTPACVRAADASPSRTAPSANPAGRRDALKSESSTPPGERKDFADGAVRKSSMRLRLALRAPQGT